MLLLIYSSPLPTISFPVLLPIPSSSFPTPHPRPPTLPPFLASSSPFCLVLVKFSKFASEVYSKPFSFFPPSLNVLSPLGFFFYFSRHSQRIRDKKKSEIKNPRKESQTVPSQFLNLNIYQTVLFYFFWYQTRQKPPKIRNLKKE